MAIQDNFDRLKAFYEGPFEGLITPSEIADVFKIDESTIRHAIKSGRLELGRDCFKFGKQWVLSKNAFPKLARHGGWSEYSQLRTEYCKAKSVAENPTLP